MTSGWQVCWEARVTSTQDEARQRAMSGAPHGVVVATLDQTGGRGRHGRPWVTPPGAGLAVSAVLRPDLLAGALPRQRWTWLPLVTGLAVAEAVDDVAGRLVRATLKWPNDVLVVRHSGEAKLAGILSERLETPTGPVAIVGIGLNLQAGGLPAGAVALGELLQSTPDAASVTSSLLTRLDEHLEALATASATTVGAAYRRRCSTIGRDVRVELPGSRRLAGRAVGVDAFGRLVVRPAGEADVVSIAAGDVVHLRPTDSASDVP